jgi:energy-coupling factor transporter ATP-binding protein EcfA2
MPTNYHFFDGKVILRIRNTICDTPEELLSTDVFAEVLKRYVVMLSQKRSRLLRVFRDPGNITSADMHQLALTLRYLVTLPADLVQKIVDGSGPFLANRELMDDFVEQFYNYWRSLHRLVVCDSIGDRYDERPYRTFNETVETLMHVVRSTYRDVRDNITGNHPRIYRQVSAGAEIGTIAMNVQIPYPTDLYNRLNKISVTSQVLIYPPMIFETPMNKRSGVFQKVDHNPLEGVDINPAEWLCYPAKVGSLLIMVYFSVRFFELVFSLSNLFELAPMEELNHVPDAVFLFGVPPKGEHIKGQTETVFYDDDQNQILVATIPFRDEYGYFGYLKKMILTLHNSIMLKRGRMPYHGAMFHIVLRDRGAFTLLLIGDSGAGKSETLEALRHIIRDEVEDLIIIADDMGSLDFAPDGRVMGYGTEMGAFVRLDDLQSGYAFGQIDRTIIMNPDQVNARVVLPVTKYSDVVKGYPVDCVLYANNYEVVDETHPVIQPFSNDQEALAVFRTGAVMSKGTTTSTGLVNSFYANIFGPPMYPERQEELAQKYFKAFFDQDILVGELRTQLGIHGMEQKGPDHSARMLLEEILRRAKKVA